MIELIFTIDYEIYGNGLGSLKDLVYKPAERIKVIFKRHNAPLVVFAELAELEMIEITGSDKGIELVKQQLKEFHEEGYEIGLHLHPQWYNGRHENGEWTLDYDEYNLCTLSTERIAQIVDRSISFLRRVIGSVDYIPLCYRGGNWLLQPTEKISHVLADRGIRIDSSVFPGGFQHANSLDYRPSLKNGYYWRFSEDVNKPDAYGAILELPIYTKMVPIWKILRAKRVNLQKRTLKQIRSKRKKVGFPIDLLRLRYPMKLDFCRMTKKEMSSILEPELLKDRKNANQYRPIVAIGHTKDLVDYKAVEFILCYLRDNGARIVSFREAYSKLI